MSTKLFPSPNNRRRYTSRLSIVFLIIGLFFSLPAQSQVNVNISLQSLWGPVGYDYIDYYYLPEADIFYSVPTREFIYWNGGRWVFATNLPGQFNIDLYSTYKVVVNEPKPYLQHDRYVERYAQYKHGGPHQITIRDSDDERYYSVKGHPKHEQWRAENNGNERSREGKGRPTGVERKSDRKNQPERSSGKGDRKRKGN